MTRVLVTGGAGYVGSHCCKALAEAGFEPVVFDNFVMGHENAVRFGPLIKGDMRDTEALRAAIEETKPEAVLHFAALTLVGESTSHPGRYYAVNVGGTLNLLEAMHAAGVSKLVFSSTCAVYGAPERVPITEDLPFRPINPYGATKVACEWLMEDFDRAHAIRSVRLRYFNAAGADPAAEIGEWHEPETHLVPLVLDAVVGRRPSISIFGTDYATPDGSAVRDYIHVMDLAAAHVAALRYLMDGGASAAVNLGTGRGASVREVDRRRRSSNRPARSGRGIAPTRRRSAGPRCGSPPRRGASQLAGDRRPPDHRRGRLALASAAYRARLILPPAGR